MRQPISILLLLLMLAAPALSQSINRPGRQEGKQTTLGSSSVGQSFYRNLSDCLKCNATGDWAYVLGWLQRYSAKHAYPPGGGVITDETFFSNELLYIAEYSAASRSENGGWAGDLVRVSFLVAISDIERNPDHWHDEFFPGDSRKGVSCEQFADYAPFRYSGEFNLMCGLFRDGVAHFARHLLPAFNCYYRENLKLFLRTQTAKTRLDAIDLFLGKTETEHEAFLKNAVVPAFAKLNRFWNSLMRNPYQRWDLLFGKMSEATVIIARATRKAVLYIILSNLHDDSQITTKERVWLSAKYSNPVTTQ